MMPEDMRDSAEVAAAFRDFLSNTFDPNDGS
jgi:hypothetical protein